MGNRWTREGISDEPRTMGWKKKITLISKILTTVVRLDGKTSAGNEKRSRIRFENPWRTRRIIRAHARYANVMRTQRVIDTRVRSTNVVCRVHARDEKYVIQIRILRTPRVRHVTCIIITYRNLVCYSTRYGDGVRRSSGLSSDAHSFVVHDDIVRLVVRQYWRDAIDYSKSSFEV
jgi:hypothetical protein